MAIRAHSVVSPISSVTAPAGDYRLLDSGHAAKLEKLGPYTIVRPAPQAIWSPRLAQGRWNEADAMYSRNQTGSGAWEWRRTVKREFDVLFADLAFRIKLTDFGHIGLFPEQAPSWDWLRDAIRRRLRATNGRNLHVLNLFAYTGGSTLAASQAGAHVVHVDAAKGVVDWARENVKLCHLADKPVRWLVDDALKFAKREERRGARYQGIILDPPSFGRGPKGEVFKLEEHLPALLEACAPLLADDALFVLHSSHTPGFTPFVLMNQVDELVRGRGGSIEHGEMVIADEQGRNLPSGAFARWIAAG